MKIKNVRHLVAFALVATLVLTGNYGTMRADGPHLLSVDALQQIQIGTLTRSSERIIAPNGSEAAQFIVTGKPNRKVTIAISVQTLVLDNGGVANGLDAAATPAMPLSVTASDVLFSTDGGVTWQPFSSDALLEDLRFPKAHGTDVAQILVRVGCHVIASESQQRGPYTGTIAVSAEYARGDDDGDSDSDSDSDRDSNGDSDGDSDTDSDSDGGSGGDSDGDSDSDSDSDHGVRARGGSDAVIPSGGYQHDDDFGNASPSLRD